MRPLPDQDAFFPRDRLPDVLLTSPTSGIAARCTATGLAILAPGRSRLCAVCGRRCLQAGELAALAQGARLGAEAVGAASAAAGDRCGACGGKFVA